MSIDLRNAAAVTVADIKVMNINDLNTWVGVDGHCSHLFDEQQQAQRVVSELARMEVSARQIAREYTATEIERMRGRHADGSRRRAQAIYTRALAIQVA